MALRCHDGELAGVVGGLSGNGDTKHPFGHAGVMGTTEDCPRSADGSQTQEAGRHLSADASAYERAGDGIVLAAASLVKQASRDAICGNFGREGRELDFRLGGSAGGGLGKFLFLDKGIVSSQ